ncbi:MAG: alpha-ketoacid dehydrogenase subunit beta [Nitrososphaerota archaeon]|nr:alpha-ketoacid dehydrogenase subunit beta [Nitrososphaerota archaeon]
MTVMNIVQAVNRTLRDEMRRNGNMIVLGEDVGRDGGVFRATEGLLDEFGAERVVDTPLSEDGIVGMAIGMSLYGLLPVAEIQFMDFIYPAFNQIVSELAKFRYRSGGQYPAHVVIRTPYGGGVKGGHYHSQSTEAYFIHTPGLTVVTPSSPHDTKGLLLSAMRSPDPVMFLEPKRLYRTIKEDVPDEEYLIPIGKANVVQEGSDITLVSWGPMVQTCKEALPLAAKEKMSVELIDLRSLMPFDIQTVIQSVKKTGRVVVAHEATKVAGFGAEISAQVSERAIDSLKAPIIRVAGYDTPFPYALENSYLPKPERILKALRKASSY